MRNTIVSGVVAAIALLAGMPPAHAVLQVSSTFNGVAFDCVDNAACDLNKTTGVLSLGTVTVGGVVVEGSIQTQVVGANNILNSTSLSVTNTNSFSVPIVLAIAATDFAGPATTYDASASATFQQAVGSTFNVGFYDDPLNAQGADSPTDHPGDLVASGSKNVTLVADSFQLNAAGPLIDPDTGPFSMTLTASGDLTAGGIILSRGQDLLKPQAAVPEPGSLALLGAALLGFVGLRRQMRPENG